MRRSNVFKSSREDTFFIFHHMSTSFHRKVTKYEKVHHWQKKNKDKCSKSQIKRTKKIKSLGQNHEKLLKILFHSSVLFNRHIKLLVSVAFQWLTDD